MVAQLIKAAAKGNVEEVRRLLDDDENQKEVDDVELKHAALFDACSNGHVEVAQLLLERGANVNQTSTRGRTVLMEAASLGNTYLVTVLLENGANLSVQDEFKETVFHKVAKNKFQGGNHLAVTKVLMLYLTKPLFDLDEDNKTPSQTGEDGPATAYLKLCEHVLAIGQVPKDPNNKHKSEEGTEEESDSSDSEDESDDSEDDENNSEKRKPTQRQTTKYEELVSSIRFSWKPPAATRRMTEYEEFVISGDFNDYVQKTGRHISEDSWEEFLISGDFDDYQQGKNDE